MAVDITAEELVEFKPAAVQKRCPGLKGNRRTLYRWKARGLETAKIGGRRYTSAEALQRFAERSDGNTPNARTPARRRKAQAAAAAVLDAAGI